MRIFSFIFWLIVIIVIAIFVSQNSIYVDLHYLFGTAKIYFPLLIILILAIGALCGIFLLLPGRIRVQHYNHQLRQNNQELKQKLEKYSEIEPKEL